MTSLKSDLDSSLRISVEATSPQYVVAVEAVIVVKENLTFRADIGLFEEAVTSRGLVGDDPSG